MEERGQEEVNKLKGKDEEKAVRGEKKRRKRAVCVCMRKRDRVST